MLKILYKRSPGKSTRTCKRRKHSPVKSPLHEMNP